MKILRLICKCSRIRLRNILQLDNWRRQQNQHQCKQVKHVESTVESWTAFTFWSLVHEQCCHFRCFNIRPDVFNEISYVWCFGEKSDVEWAVVCVFHIIPLLFGWKQVRFVILKFLSSVSEPHVCLVIVPNWRSSLHCVEKNVQHPLRMTDSSILMTILRSIEDSTRVIALC